MKHKQIPVSTTILFADIRGYTDLSQQIEAGKLNQLLHQFYDRCSAAVWENDGIVNKFIGDAVLAIFNFPLIRKEHVQNAVSAAVQLQKNCQHLKEEIGLGDFNTLSKTKCTETRRFLESKGYQSAFPTGTPTWRGAGLRLHADWVFTKGVVVERWGVAKPLSVSDHWPVWVEISIKSV